jgi:hypothetical protein
MRRGKQIYTAVVVSSNTLSVSFKKKGKPLTHCEM